MHLVILGSCITAASHNQALRLNTVLLLLQSWFGCSACTRNLVFIRFSSLVNAVIILKPLT
uniref:Uncharacterized protein n=1 Tax=Oryza brachyantha TaxID=4533 RepID=J3MJ87_ORYBR